MYVQKLTVKGFGPLRRLYNIGFEPSLNIIIGMNGTGKTHIMNLLATLAGNDAATELCVGMPIEYVSLVLQDGKSITMRGHLDETVIHKFKAELGDSRINYGLPENITDRYHHGCCNNATFQELITHYIVPEKANHFSFNNPNYSCGGGDGFKQMTMLAMLKSYENGPLLIESPEHHVDITASRHLLTMLSRGTNQVIYTTHSPEFVSTSENIIDLSP